MRETLYSLNDYELLYMIRTGDSMAYQLLLGKYEKYIKQLLNKHFDYVVSTSKEDLNQECRILLTDLTQTYRDDQDCRFLTYLVNGIRHRLSSIQRNERRKMNHVQLLSLDCIVSEDANSTYLDVVDPKYAFYQPDYEWRYAESLDNLHQMLMTLSDKEKVVWHLMNGKLSYDEAAEKSGMTRRQFDSIRMRLKKKVVFCVMKPNDTGNRH